MPRRCCDRDKTFQDGGANWMYKTLLWAQHDFGEERVAVSVILLLECVRETTTTTTTTKQFIYYNAQSAERLTEPDANDDTNWMDSFASTLIMTLWQQPRHWLFCYLFSLLANQADCDNELIVKQTNKYTILTSDTQTVTFVNMKLSKLIFHVVSWLLRACIHLHKIRYEHLTINIPFQQSFGCNCMSICVSVCAYTPAPSSLTPSLWSQSNACIHMI